MTVAENKRITPKTFEERLRPGTVEEAMTRFKNKMQLSPLMRARPAIRPTRAKSRAGGAIVAFEVGRVRNLLLQFAAHRENTPKLKAKLQLLALAMHRPSVAWHLTRVSYYNG